MQQLSVAASFALTHSCIIDHPVMWERWGLKHTDTLFKILV